MQLPRTKSYQRYQTPDYIYEPLDKEFRFDHDPCPEGAKDNGLFMTWGMRNFVNPPYNNIRPWIEKAIEEQEHGHLTVLLLPVHTDTKWFHELVKDRAEIRFIRSRIQFVGAKSRAPFPSMLVIYRPASV